MPFPVDAILFVFLLTMAVVIARRQELFSAAMLTGLFSLLSAGLFTLMDALDVAFTEAAVGAGFSTILLLGALTRTTGLEYQQRRPRTRPLMIVFSTGAALIYGTLDMPHFGDPAAAIHHHVTPDYLARTPVEIDVPNVVTAVLASYRGYDTLGETMVIFVGGVGVLLVLTGRWRWRRRVR
ncbi:MAG: DUF4040 domain-containing protein [Acidobacteria bacterium]|nr:MAG: DUF4040 domain-containing protein [Acidobacteriota bacterium]